MPGSFQRSQASASSGEVASGSLKKMRQEQKTRAPVRFKRTEKGSGEFPLPIDERLPALLATLGERANAVLVAPPGAGKTTRVPLALHDESWAAGKRIILLEPRRLA